MRFAAIVCPALLLFAATTVNAHGPRESGHPGGGHPNLAGGPGGGSGFKPGNSGGPTGLADKVKAIHADGGGKTGKPDFAGLHPSAAGALKAGIGNNATPLLGNLAGQGGGAGLAHHAGELLGFLEMAKNSSDPQVAAKATQILQQFQQHIAQERANSSQGATGALQAAQSGNQLVAIQTKQLADLTAVMASIARAQSLDAARTLETQAQAQAQMQNFLNYGAGYQPGNAQMFH